MLTIFNIYLSQIYQVYVFKTSSGSDWIPAKTGKQFFVKQKTHLFLFHGCQGHVVSQF